MGDITQLLERFGAGDRAADSDLMELVYAELHRIAAAYVHREHPGHSLQPTALINEAYLRLVRHPPESWVGRTHFYGIAARLMRQILVDYARAAGTAKRSGKRVDIELAGWLPGTPFEPERFLTLNTALDELHAISERCARTVELRFIAGLDVEETAQLLDISSTTVRREWEFARVWLENRLRGSGA